MRAWRTTLTVTAIASAVLLTAGITTAVGVARAGTAGPAARTAHAGVPWGRVGAGWVLAQPWYSTALPPSANPGPSALYLISPGGTRYELASWPDGNTAPSLVAWSPDGKRALFHARRGGRVEQLTLATGQWSTFVLPGASWPIGYTTPDGLNIVAYEPSGTGYRLARYSLSGRLTSALGYSADDWVLYAPSGTEFVTGAGDGLKLVSNGGALVRQLPVPAHVCTAVRWWDASTVLASCTPPDLGRQQLWLVPLSGRRPTALTPERHSPSRDLGDLDAWSLPSGLYLQSAGSCGMLQIFRQAPSGSVTPVTVPNIGGSDVLTALGSRLLIQETSSCSGSTSLLWYDPGTRAEQWVFLGPYALNSLVDAVPFYSPENGDL